MPSQLRPKNRLLLSLPVRDLERIVPHLEHIPCKREQTLLDADSALDYVFFPDSGVISIVAVYADGSIIDDGYHREMGGAPASKHSLAQSSRPHVSLCNFLALPGRCRAKHSLQPRRTSGPSDG
jgi:hypothetical protein